MGNKAYVYTAHAVERLEERNIKQSWVQSTLEVPDISEEQADRPGRWRLYRRIAAFGWRVLCVVCDEKEATIEIVTAFFDRRKQL